MKLTQKQKTAGALLGLLVLFGGSSGAAELPSGKKKTKEQERRERVLATLPLTRPAAKKWGIPLPILLAVLDVESHGWPHAKSPVGAMGYMQLMPSTAKTYVPEGVDPYNPEANINGGAHLLHDLFLKYQGDWLAVFTHYNAGGARLKRNKKNYRWVYVNAVLDRLAIWKKLS
jgi:soluble lytic murein transglycosylase-like protein